MAQNSDRLKKIAYIPRHNWSDIGFGVYVCKECQAELEYSEGRTIYTPGDGSCIE